jgi:hypothetical protein
LGFGASSAALLPTSAARLRMLPRKKAFADHNVARERAQWLFNYDPLTVPLQ